MCRFRNGFRKRKTIHLKASQWVCVCCAHGHATNKKTTVTEQQGLVSFVAFLILLLPLLFSVALHSFLFALVNFRCLLLFFVAFYCLIFLFFVSACFLLPFVASWRRRAATLATRGRIAGMIGHGTARHGTTPAAACGHANTNKNTNTVAVNGSRKAPRAQRYRCHMGADCAWAARNKRLRSTTPRGRRAHSETVAKYHT